MRILKALRLIVVAYLLAAPIPLIVVETLDVRLDWHSMLYTFLFLWSFPVFLFAETVPILPAGRYALLQYDLLYLAVSIPFAALLGFWKASGRRPLTRARSEVGNHLANGS